jgi:PIN domain nuclease of toxin-antitoxin system
MIYLDTHVVVWLFIPKIDLLSDPVKRQINSEHLLLSPMVLLELEYLYESGRIKENAETILNSLTKTTGLTVCDFPFPRIARAARKLIWTRDPFDRIIVGHAVARGKKIITKDRSILDNYTGAVW